MHSLIVRPVKSEELHAAVEIDRLCFDGLWTFNAYLRELASPNSDLLGIFWDQPSQPAVAPLNTDQSAKSMSVSVPPLIGLGCLWAILEEAHISLLAIHPNYRGQGLGQLLLWTLLETSWQRKLERATLEVKESNLPAIALYTKFGFKEAGRRKRYYKDTEEDALILWLNGLHQPEFAKNLARWKQETSDRLLNYQWVYQKN